MVIKTLIIIPCYNEEKRLPVEDFLSFARQHSDVGFLFVNDGSKDNTTAVLQKMKTDCDTFFVLDNKQNQGKAEAIRSAMLYATENFDVPYIGFFDADLATPLHEICNIDEQILPQKNYFMVACSRIRRMGVTIDRTWKRHIYGRIFGTIASIILMLPVYDTQCGAKIIRRDVAKKIFAEPFNSRWFFDIELFARIILNYGYQSTIDGIYEYPMTEWYEKGDSRLKIKDYLKTPMELFKLNKVYHKKIKQQKLKENK